MAAGWFRPRGYRHLDAAVGEAYAANAESPDFVRRHSFLPLLHYTKKTKRYRPLENRTDVKKREIMFASHRDACILSWYALSLGEALDAMYQAEGLAECVIAYRKLGLANYNFAGDVLRFAKRKAPCTILCFDVSDFFGTLDHRLLKSRLKRVLAVTELPADWYAVYRHVTKYSWIDVETLKSTPPFAERLKRRGRAPVATMAEILAASIPVHQNDKSYGIPQGTPISATFANLYMIDFDAALEEFCCARGALYRRYSDDILIVCNEVDATEMEAFLKDRLQAEKLVMNEDKTERRRFGPTETQDAQYLGFNLSPEGATIRQSSISRHWRKIRRSIRRIRKIGEAAMAAGKADKVYTKTLRRRFTALSVRNFSSYARRSADALDAPKIRRQVRRLERYAETQLSALSNPAAQASPGEPSDT